MGISIYNYGGSKVRILEEKDNKLYTDFLEKHERCNFQQALEWGKVKDSWKNEVVLAEGENGEIIGSISILIRKIPIFGNIMYSSRGPVCDIYDEEVLAQLTEGVKKLAKKYKAFVFKAEPDIKSDDKEFRKVITKLGSKKSMFFGFLGYVIFTYGMYLAGNHIPLLITCTFLSSICTNFASSPMYAFCSDTMDEVEYKTGVRPQGVMTSVMMCFTKIGVAMAGIIFSQVLRMGGYVADTPQTPAAICAIQWNLFWLPIISTILCMLLALFYHLDKHHKQIAEALEARKL